MSAAAVQWALPAIAFVAVWMLLTPASLAIHRLARSRLAALVPQARSTLLLALAVLPLTVAALVAVLGFTPALGGWIVDAHCHDDTGCRPHVPILHGGAPVALAFGAALLAAAGALASRAFGRLRRTQRLASVLGSLAEPAPRGRFEILASDEAFAYCVGFWRPKVVVSSGLTERLSPDEQRAVLAHEHAHAARRDNLRHGIAALGLLPLGPNARRALLADLALASEQACDRVAAEVTGAHAVQAALAALEGAPRLAAARGATFDGADTLASRCRALAANRGGTPAAGAVPATIALAYAVCTLVTTYLAHHGAELALGWLG